MGRRLASEGGLLDNHAFQGADQHHVCPAVGKQTVGDGADHDAIELRLGRHLIG